MFFSSVHIYEAAWFETKHQSFADSADETFWYVSNFCCNKQDRHSFPKPRLSQVEVELLLFQLGLAAAKIVFTLSAWGLTKLWRVLVQFGFGEM